MSALVEHVKAYAMEHYNDGGWDVIVECWGDSEIAEVLTEAGAVTEADARAAFAPLVDTWQDRQADAEFHQVEALGVEDFERYYGHAPRWHG
ncbi:hypothetical protein [Streptomyces wuyuanensis]|uniref:hypothetical protein n=1 Tax=Streptomyces wuyuanensis TaxID=1196353 RepID=UPI0034395650